MGVDQGIAQLYRINVIATGRDDLRKLDHFCGMVRRSRFYGSRLCAKSGNLDLIALIRRGGSLPDGPGAGRDIGSVADSGYILGLRILNLHVRVGFLPPHVAYRRAKNKHARIKARFIVGVFPRGQ